MAFCPFINDECNPDCVFNNNCFEEGDSENCNLVDAIRNIQSDGFVERSPKDYLEDIEHKLSNIDLNTSSDQTDSYSILSEIRDIKRLLRECLKD